MGIDSELAVLGLMELLKAPLINYLEIKANAIFFKGKISLNSFKVLSVQQKLLYLVEQDK